jgi:hypothetical protein
MRLNKNIKITLIGAIVWLGTFVVRAFLFTPEGNPSFNVLLTQNIFFITQTLFAMLALLYYMKGLQHNFIREGVVIGIIWFVVSCLLDFAILMPLFNIKFDAWLLEIMPSYFALPILSIGGGAMAKAHRRI